ncbi:MAG: CHASE3 domain-containing protein, partial [Acidobacteria bacterium]|nr:CHASE3 domain-containing protein [Acidobacteriota bacterium]
MNVRRTIRFAIALPVALVGSIAILLAFQVRDLLGDAEWVRHTVQVKAEVYEAQKLLLDQESGLRGFLLTRENRFLEPYVAGSTALPTTLDHLEELISDAPQRQERVRDLRNQYAHWHEWAEASRHDASPDVTVAISPQLREMLSQRKEAMDQMREVASRMLVDENRLQEERQTRLSSRVRTFAISTGILFALFAVLSATLLRLWIR